MVAVPILLDGRPVSGLSAAQSQVLLFYLAVNGRPQLRLTLAGLLWPDKQETERLAVAKTQARTSIVKLGKQSARCPTWATG